MSTRCRSEVGDVYSDAYRIERPGLECNFTDVICGAPDCTGTDPPRAWRLGFVDVPTRSRRWCTGHRRICAAAGVVGINAGCARLPRPRLYCCRIPPLEVVATCRRPSRTEVHEPLLPGATRRTLLVADRL